MRCVDGAAFHSGHARERGAATFGPHGAAAPRCDEWRIRRGVECKAPCHLIVAQQARGHIFCSIDNGRRKSRQNRFRRSCCGAVGRRGRNIGSLRRGVCCHGDEQGEYEFSHVAKIQKIFDKELIVVRRIHVFAIICLPVSYPRLSCGLFILSPTVCRKPSARSRQLPLLIFVQRPPSLARKCGAHSAVIRI